MSALATPLLAWLSQALVPLGLGALCGFGAQRGVFARALGRAPWRAYAWRKRTARVEAQLDTWLVVLSNALRATPSLARAIEDSAARVGGPLGDELRVAVNETHLGTPLDRALDALSERVPSRPLHAALTTLRIARMTGGDLSAILDDAAASLRELARLEAVVRTKTAEGRAQLCGLLDALSPSLLAPLWESTRGHVVLAAALALWLAALLLARRITRVEV
jgi:tight adherence protein B